MKKSVVVICIVVILVIFAAGFICGSNSVLRTPKWVEQDGGLYLVVTDWMGNQYIDIANQTSDMYDSFAFAIGRR